MNDDPPVPSPAQPPPLVVVDRRGFLSAVAGIGAWYLPDSPFTTLAPQVEATATVFSAQPDGRNVLVRFTVTGVSAQAGRLRVYDRSRRLLGTAGMLGVGGRLYGELWVPIAGDPVLATEVETPGSRTVIRTTHRISVPRRWTIHWAPVADPQTLARGLDERTAGAAPEGDAIARQGVAGNIIPGLTELAALDHPAFLQLGIEAARLASTHGVPVSRVALDQTGATRSIDTIAMALAGSGVRLVVYRDRTGVPLSWIQSPDGSRILAMADPPGADLAARGLAAGGDEMARRIEAWLTSENLVGTTQRLDSVLLVSEGSGSELAAIEEWNSRFAFPRIMVNRVDDLVAAVERQAASAPTVGRPLPSASQPDPAAITRLVATRTRASADRTDQIVRTLAERLSVSDTSLAGVAGTLVFPVPGVLAFNPTPYTRTDLVKMPDGSDRVITDVPPLGWVVQPGATGGRWDPVPGEETLAVDGNYFSARLDPESGAIRSLRGRFDGAEHVRYPGPGLNALPHARLERTALFRLAGVGSRLVAYRRLGTGATVQSSVTLYNDLPWIDLENDTGGADGGLMEYRFDLALDDPRVSWEIPGGVDRSSAPVPRLTHLRWLAVEGAGRVALLRGLDAPAASVDPDGVVGMTVATSRSRFRLGMARADTADADPWRFGWATEPLIAASVSGTGNTSLPSFGSLLVVDQPGALIVGAKPANDGRGIVVFVQEILNATRPITIGAGALGFGGARLTDFLERDGEALPMLAAGGTVVPLKALSVVAVRLTDLRLAGR